jgi:uncharacterized membrane protein YdcZ (DUF606 family)
MGVVTDYALYILIGGCFYIFIFTAIPSYQDLGNSTTASCITILVLIRSISVNPSQYVEKKPYKAKQFKS